MSTPNAQWTRPSVWLHWVMVLLFISMFVLAELIDLHKGVQKIHYIQWHKSTGILILMLAAARLWWNIAHPGPRPIGPKWQQHAAKSVHYLLYFLMFAMPASGYVMSMMAGKPVSFYGIFPIPSLLGPHEAYKDLAHDVHGALASIILLVVSGHATMALYHHFILKDATLRRMSRF